MADLGRHRKNSLAMDQLIIQLSGAMGNTDRLNVSQIKAAFLKINWSSLTWLKYFEGLPPNAINEHQQQGTS